MKDRVSRPARVFGRPTPRHHGVVSRTLLASLALVATLAAGAVGRAPAAELAVALRGTPQRAEVGPAVPRPPRHRIAVRVVHGEGEFFVRATRKRFVPRGNNYLRRGRIELPSGERVGQRSTTFMVGGYDARGAERALREMHRLGYNVVRVWLDELCRSACSGDPVTQGVSRRYVANVADFLRRAKRNHIFVLLVVPSTPAGTTYERTVNRSCCMQFGATNAWFLTQGGIEGFAAYWRALLRELIRQRAPTDAIWAYSLENEAHFRADEPPLSRSAGTVMTANGRSYDLASPLERQQMMDENLVHWVDRLRAAIRSIDPTALVTIGFFWPQGPHATRPGDPRLIRTKPVVDGLSLDFVDLHTYPALELSLPQFVENYELPRITRKPVVLGEFGAFHFAFPTPASAADAMRRWQIESCAFGFDGWLLWTWDTKTPGPNELNLWTAKDGDAAIGRSLAPAARPDPCA